MERKMTQASTNVAQINSAKKFKVPMWRRQTYKTFLFKCHCLWNGDSKTLEKMVQTSISNVVKMNSMGGGETKECSMWREAYTPPAFHLKSQLFCNGGIILTTWKRCL